MTLNELRSLIKEKTTSAETLVEDSDSTEGMSEEAQADFDTLTEEIEKLNKTYENQSKVASLKSDLKVLPTQEPAGEPANVSDPIPRGLATVTPNLDPKAGFNNIGEFAQKVFAAQNPINPVMDDRISAMYEVQGAPTNFHQEGGAAEGFMIPPQFINDIFELMFAEESILNMVNPSPTSSNQVTIILDETTPWGTAGINASWTGEGVQLSAEKVETKSSNIKLHKLTAFVLATDEILADTALMNDRLMKRAPMAINWEASDAIINGSGAGQPLGVLNSGALVSVAKESGQAADTINEDNIAKMYSRMWPSSLSSAKWLINSDIMPQLMTMTLGDNAIFMLPQFGFVGAPGGFLLGRPIIPTESAKTLGDKGDIIFFAPEGYYASVKQGTALEFASSIHLFFDFSITAFRFIFRVGGTPWLSKPVDPNNGSNTKSHFVTLDARA